MKLSMLAQEIRQAESVQLIGRYLKKEEEKAELIAAVKGEEGCVQMFLLCNSLPEREYPVQTFQNNRERLLNTQERSAHLLDWVKNVRIGNRSVAVTQQERSRIDREEMLLLSKLIYQGWEPSLSLDSECLQMVTLTLDIRWEEIYPLLLQLKKDKKLPVELLKNSFPLAEKVKKQMTLTLREEKDRHFTLTIRGKKYDFWIERVYQYDPWEEIEKGESHFTKEEWIKLVKNQEKICPKGQRLTVIEYENGQQIQLNFYDEEYLNKESSHHAKIGIWMNRQTGKHGFPLRSEILQTPYPAQELKKCRVEILRAYLPQESETLIFC